MFNNFIGGGQVFLHKVRMLRQVVSTTIVISLLVGAMLSWKFSSFDKLDCDGAITYGKAKLALMAHPVLSVVSINQNQPVVDAYSGGKLWKKRMLASSVISHTRFKSAWEGALSLLYLLAIKSLAFGIAAGALVFALWSKFGRDLKTVKRSAGSNVILSNKQVRRRLKQLGLASRLHIGIMPFVQDMETRHFLVTGSTGSGKTNLLHNLLPQVEDAQEPAIIIDQTGEMVAKYYNPERGDILFNPFDARNMTWDFWADCSKLRHLEKFADTLIGFNSRKNNRNTADFWEEAARTVFVELVRYLQRRQLYSLADLRKLIHQSSQTSLRKILQGTDAAQYFAQDNAKAAASIMSVLSANIKPLRFLRDQTDNRPDHRHFSVREYIHNIDQGFSGWLFLAAESSTRELSTPINASLAELLIASLMQYDRPQGKHIWFIMDELAAFGRFPSLAKLMQEGRKYGACVVAGLQSSSQLFAHYGGAEASNLFALFKTKFAFASDDPMMAQLYSAIYGYQTITRQQKNTSFGANILRDGISYNEQEQEKPLVKLEDFASLKTGECYTLLPLPEVRLSKMQVPVSTRTDRNPGFIEAEEMAETEACEATEAEGAEMVDGGDDDNAQSPRKQTHQQVSTEAVDDATNGAIADGDSENNPKSSTRSAPELQSEQLICDNTKKTLEVNLEPGFD